MRMLNRLMAAALAVLMMVALAPAALAAGGVVIEDAAGSGTGQAVSGGVVGGSVVEEAAPAQSFSFSFGKAFEFPVAESVEYTISSGFQYDARTWDASYDMTYVIGVDVTNQVITVVAKGDTGVYDQVVRQFICSTGTKKDPTPLGTHTLAAGDRVDWAYFKTYKCYVRYPVRIYGNYFFHSLLYSRQDVSSLKSSSLRNLGSRASHGCIRMLDHEVQWMSENCHEGTIVVVYEGVKNEELTQSLKP